MSLRDFDPGFPWYLAVIGRGTGEAEFVRTNRGCKAAIARGVKRWGKENTVVFYRPTGAFLSVDRWNHYGKVPA